MPPSKSTILFMTKNTWKKSLINPLYSSKLFKKNLSIYSPIFQIKKHEIFRRNQAEIKRLRGVQSGRYCDAKCLPGWHGVHWQLICRGDGCLMHRRSHAYAKRRDCLQGWTDTVAFVLLLITSATSQRIDPAFFTTTFLKFLKFFKIF